MNNNFWYGKKVLLTGHTGFKGSWLSLWLQRLGADLVGYALAPSTNPSMFEMADVGSHMKSIEGDVRDLEHLRAVMETHQPDIVIHFAAQAIVSLSHEDPVTTFSTNIMGTVNLLEAIRTTGSCRVALCITSDKCYENEGWIWGYRETDALGGRDPYSSSKASAELVIRAYRESFFPLSGLERHGIAIASARAGNVIGGGDWTRDRLVPDLIKSLSVGEPAIVRNPDALRPWQFVLEPLSGYLQLAERLWDDAPQYIGGWNFGPKMEEIRPVSWIADYIVDKWDDGAQWLHQGAVKDSKKQSFREENLLKLDVTKAAALLDWSPRLNLATTLDWIVEWHQAVNHGDSVRPLIEKQISKYEVTTHPYANKNN